MKLIKFLKTFSPLTQTFLYNLVNGLSGEMPNTRVLTTRRENQDTRPFPLVDIIEPERALISDVIESILPATGSLLYRMNKGTEYRFQNALLRYFERECPDIVHAHFGTDATMIYRACRDYDIPFVVSFRGYDASRVLNEKKWQSNYRDMFQYCSAVVLVSEEMRSRIEPLAPASLPIKTIHAGKNPDDYVFRLREKPIRTFISIGRLVEKKGHLDAIKAVNHARAKGADIVLRIIGEGPLRGELEELIHQYHLESVVTLVGKLPHEHVKKELDDADGFILACCTSIDGDKEGVPNVLKEAQLMGLPVITTDHGGIPYVVPPENHRWVVAEGDWMAMSQCMVDLSRSCNQTIKEITTLGRNHVVQHFSFAQEVQRHIALYQQILATR